MNLRSEELHPTSDTLALRTTLNMGYRLRNLVARQIEEAMTYSDTLEALSNDIASHDNIPFPSGIMDKHHTLQQTSKVPQAEQERSVIEGT